MTRRDDESTIAHPEVLTLHWEGPAEAESPVEVRFDSEEEAQEAFFAEREREFREIRRSEQGQILWTQIQEEAKRKGDEKLWRKRVHAFWWVKMKTKGTAREYAERFDVNHATVRTWIADVAKLAYQVGYRLHEDKLLLVGDAPVELKRLRELVNRDAASSEARQALEEVEGDFRGRDPYFHLNEGHFLRARGELRASDETLKEGLMIAEARGVRALLWNARGQTLWDCGPESSYPAEDHLGQAEMCFRRAAILDQSTYFPFVNLAHMAVDAGDTKRAEYWIGEVATARKGMDDVMKIGLAEYLEDAEWTPAVEEKRFWRSGPMKWIQEIVKKGALALAALVLLAGLAFEPASGATLAPDDGPVAHGKKGGGRDGSNSGAGGN